MYDYNYMQYIYKVDISDSQQQVMESEALEITSKVPKQLSLVPAQPLLQASPWCLLLSAANFPSLNSKLKDLNP